MIFTQAEFLIFFLVVLAAVWSARTRFVRNLVLLVASYYFYAYWDYRFCGLLLLSTAVDFNIAKWMHRSDRDAVRRSLLAASVTVNLSILGTFKYANFFIDSAKQVFDGAGLGSQSLDLILPVGISFYTFQTLSYTIDVYRRKLSPTQSIVDFALVRCVLSAIGGRPDRASTGTTAAIGSHACFFTQTVLRWLPATTAWCR